tara:strand:+ start:95 stop:1195 length:1101 start_codon:yes stop_codon:yes gene_type:complete
MSNRKKNVLHLIAGLGAGGAERQLLELLKQNKDHVLCSFTNSGVYDKNIKSLGIKFIELKVKYPALIFFKIFKIIRIIKNNNIKIIHAWMYNSCLIAILIRILIGKKKINILWGIRCSNMNSKFYSFKFRVNIILCRLFSVLADKVVYNSFAGLSYHNSIGFNSKNTSVIQNGVDEKKFMFFPNARKQLKKKYKISNDEKILLCVARVDPMKGHVSLLKAFSSVLEKNNKLKLILIGKDTEKLEKNKNVIALGMKNDIEIYYSLADFIILPSIFGEGFSNVLVEGMLSKLFPVASDIGDNKLIIGDTGLIFSCNDHTSMTNTLTKIAKMNKNDIEINSKKAYLRAKSKYTVKKMLNAYKKTYEVLT